MKQNNKHNHKYSRSERIIAGKIHDVKNKQRYHFNKWHDLDMELSMLKSKLFGKYNEKVPAMPRV